VKYAAKATVWLQIDSDYPDGVGEAQREVEWFVEQLKNLTAKGPDGAEVEIARTTDIQIFLDSKLREEPGLSTSKLFLGDVCLDDGMR
jgi:hypothetical protein